jgi:hypothetical protein
MSKRTDNPCKSWLCKAWNKPCNRGVPQMSTLFAAAAAALMLGSCIVLALGGPDWAWTILGAALMVSVGVASLPTKRTDT